MNHLPKLDGRETAIPASAGSAANPPVTIAMGSSSSGSRRTPPIHRNAFGASTPSSAAQGNERARQVQCDTGMSAGHACSTASCIRLCSVCRQWSASVDSAVADRGPINENGEGPAFTIQDARRGAWANSAKTILHGL